MTECSLSAVLETEKVTGYANWLMQSGSSEGSAEFAARPMDFTTVVEGSCLLLIRPASSVERVIQLLT
jgi:hypothetical protein